MKSLCEFLREQAIKIINFKNKKIRLSTKEQQESYKNAKICCIFFFFFKLKMIIIKIKNIVKLKSSLSLYRGIWKCCA